MACTCGHTIEEHGHDPKFPGSTSCTFGVLDGDGDEECGCIAYEAGEDDSDAE